MLIVSPSLSWAAFAVSACVAWLDLTSFRAARLVSFVGAVPATVSCLP